MASNSILKLQIDDKQYEASIKSAQNGMQALMETLRKSGKSFNDVDKQTQQYVQELGKMETRATTARGRIGELSSAFVELSQVEKQLTNQERQGTVGKALSESLEQLKKRTIEAKQELADLKKQIDIQPMPEIKMDSKSGGGDMFGGMTAVFGGNMMTKATETMMQLGSHIVDVTKRSMELAKQAEGIKIAFARLNDPTLLDNLRKATHGTVNDLELMKAAVKFNDFNLPVEQLGTMLSFAQKKAKDTGQSVDYMVESITTGLGRKSLMILDNLGLSASEVKEKMKETGDMTTAVGEIIKKQMSEAGGYVETAADRAAQSAAQVDNAMLELGEQIAKTFNGKSIDEMKNQLEVGLIQTLSSVIKEVDNVANGFDFLIEKVGGWENAITMAVGSIAPPLAGIKKALDDIGFSGSSAFGALAKAIQYSVNPLKSIWGMLKMIGIATKNIAEGGVDVGGSLGSVIANLGKKPEVPQYTPPTPKSTKSGGTKSAPKTSGKPTTAQTIEKAEQDYYNAWMKAAQDMTAGIIKGDEYGKQVNAAQYKLAEAYRKAYEATGNEKYLKSFEDTATEANTFRDALKEDAEQTKKQAEQKKKLQEAEDAYKKALDSADYGEIRKTGEALSKLQATSSGVVEGDGVSVYGKQNRGARAAYAASNNSMASLGGYISDLQADLKNADLGSAVYDSLTERLKDATMMQGVLTTLMDEGMKGADLQEAANELKAKLLTPDIDEAAWEDFVARVNEKLEEQGFDPIKIDIETGKVSKDIKATWQDAAKAVESVGSAMSQIEDPAAKVMGTVAQAIASVALGAAEAIKNYKTWQGWDWVAFAATATGTMISTIASIHSATGYAQGGIVDGTQGGFVGGMAYSGDNVGNVRLDSGELVLSRAQQSTLAAELEGNPMQDLELSTRISGRFLEIAINNDSRSRNKGKLVTTNQ